MSLASDEPDTFAYRTRALSLHRGSEASFSESKQQQKNTSIQTKKKKQISPTNHAEKIRRLQKVLAWKEIALDLIRSNLRPKPQLLEVSGIGRMLNKFAEQC